MKLVTPEWTLHVYHHASVTKCIKNKNIRHQIDNQILSNGCMVVTCLGHTKLIIRFPFQKMMWVGSYIHYSL